MSEIEETAKEMIEKGRRAQEIFEEYTQEQVDEVVTAVGWAGYSNAEYLAKFSIEETGMGLLEDRIKKIHNKTRGTLRDLKGALSRGIINIDVKTGVTEIAKPMGVIGAITPVTNPVATSINNIMVVLKGGNAVILANHPGAKNTGKEVVRLVRKEINKLKAPLDLVQAVEQPSKDLSQEIMRQADTVIATGGSAMVRAAYTSGKPALGVGQGNSVVIIDPSANVDDAVDKIFTGKTFDYATSCSSESSIVVQESIYDEVKEKFKAKGSYLVSPEEKEKLEKTIWKDGAINGKVVCKSLQEIAALSGVTSEEVLKSKCFLVEEEGIGKDYPFSGEKLTIVLAVFKYSDFDEALNIVNRITSYQGRGHSCGIHTTTEENITKLALSAKVSRIMVNQVQAFGNGGFFNNGLPFTLTMGCGSWGGNSTTENLNYKHFINICRLARPIPERRPSDEELFGQYLAKYGK
ncbi:MAG: aldehyde dehydrogenase family protein [Pseudomonadota bacterium]